LHNSYANLREDLFDCFGLLANPALGLVVGEPAEAARIEVNSHEKHPLWFRALV
jgi:hypothetical protein